MWKVTNEGDILQFVQVEEKEKTRAVEIGKRLVIHGEVCEIVYNIFSHQSFDY
jgi:hypothetical protein